ncbi:alpha-ketoacid dehydrogenase subunit beta [Asanoa iriomotensis]|uniref:alpha-ketoacid dehydrogenase subunit beta n=1 Tax=Asanoa iriomotensis TaxID=234613 RepID=UPI001942A473|nr:transketolase C-terminal domain-containing protein [Asanoa iriomotensis]
MRQAIASALSDAMREDESVLIFGEDIAAAEGPFKTSEGLLAEFGPLRVRDTPISEMGFVGAAVGAAAVGMRPVAEIMFMEFLGVALDQLVTEAAKFRYLSNGRVGVPLVVRASVGSGLGFGTQHSQTLENWLGATPGLKVAVPSDAQTAYGLLRSAIRDPDPVVVLEPRVLYAERGECVTGDAGIVPLGVARVPREGDALTVVALGQTVRAALAAAERIDAGIEVIDLSTVTPWDRETVLASVAKTGRLVTVEEAPASGGWGAEIVATVTTAAFRSLQAPPFRITAPDVPVPYNKALEARFSPGIGEIEHQLTTYLRTGEVPDPWWLREGVAA